MGCGCNCDFGNTLQYVSPAHGGWGMVRIAALIPESHQLFVAPFACGRHGALGGTLNGIKEKISYLYIDESDIVSGGYEDLIPSAIGELFDALEKRPKVLVIFVTCLDDLLGTDHTQLQKRLSNLYPDVRFISCHMNPISENMKFPPGVSIQKDLYSLLDKQDLKTDSVNFIGNHAPIDRECELFHIMKENGFELKHISDFEKFEDYQSMAQSKLNLVLSPVARHASLQMEERLGIDYLLAYNTYDLSEIRAFYLELENKLGIHAELEAYEASARKKIEEAKQIIGNHPIAIDYQAVKKPCTLAKMLIEHGFRVKMVLIDQVKNIEKEAYEYLLGNHSEVEIVNAVHPTMVRHNYRNQENYLCIGFDCGFATGSDKVYNLLLDDRLFGFYGVERLMEGMINAFTKTLDVKELIEEAHLIV